MDGSADHLLQLLLQGEIDLLLGRLPRHTAGTSAISGLVQRVLYEGSLSVVASSDMLTCCAHSAAVHSGHATAILPVTVGPEPTPVCLVWRKESAEAQRAAEQLA